MRVFSFGFILTLCFSACGPSVNPEQLKTQIQELEAENGRNPTKKRSLELISLYDIYAEAFPEDEQMSSFYLYRSAEVARSIRAFDQALAYYDQILAKYPDSEKAPQALFLKAFTLDNELKKYEEAREVYEEFLQKHPNDEFADDTEFLLNNLGKSEEEIIKSFEQKVN